MNMRVSKLPSSVFRKFKSPSFFTTSFCAICIVTTFLLSACGPYAVTFNEKVVYSPPPLLQQIQTSDRHLRDCIAQTITDRSITKAGQLKQLVCTHAGITTLAGIEQFDQLQVLNLADNKLTSLKPLVGLSRLTQLDVSENQLGEAEALLSLLYLEKLNLSENPTLPCQDLHQLAKNFQGELALPKQCQ